MNREETVSKIGYWEAVAIGIGGMVGGGIFAVLGLSVQMARAGAPLAFALAGLVALVTAYSYSKLSVTLPSAGGTVTFIDRAFGTGLIPGALNVLLWLSYVVMLSLYAHAFGSYGATLLPHRWLPWSPHVLLSLAILLLTLLNLLSVKAIGEAEDWIVGIKILILLGFVIIGSLSLHTARLSPADWAGPVPLVAGGMIIFLAYEGFELIANSAQDVRSPAQVLPRAYFSAVGFVVLLYVAVALVTLGNLPLVQIIGAKDYALAEAARPFLGHAGFVVIAVAAMLSTASAINATLYGSARLSYSIASDGELPRFLERKVWDRPVSGLLLTSAMALVTANLFDLTNISTMGSAGFLLIFAAVNLANWRLASETRSRRWICALGLGLCIAALLALLIQTEREHPWHLLVLAAMVMVSVGIAGAYRFSMRRAGSSGRG